MIFLFQVTILNFTKLIPFFRSSWSFGVDLSCEKCLILFFKIKITSPILTTFTSTCAGCYSAAGKCVLRGCRCWCWGLPYSQHGSSQTFHPNFESLFISACLGPLWEAGTIFNSVCKNLTSTVVAVVNSYQCKPEEECTVAVSRVVWTAAIVNLERSTVQ